MKDSIFPKKILLLAVLSSLAIVGISLMKNAMELEDAEQAYYSQWWRWGYDDQPPLYTWLQLAVNKIFGISKISFSILRGVIFSGVLLCLYQFGYKHLNNRAKAISIVLILVGIPTFIDFTFRRLSHTSLLCLVVVCTYFVIQELIRKKSILNYVLLGLIVSIGMLTKYNYILVLSALVLAVFWNQQLRTILFNPKILLSFVLVVFLLFPHLNWLFNDTGFVNELQSSIGSKTKNDSHSGIPVFTPLISFVLSFLKLMGPVLILGIVLFFSKRIELKTKIASGDWLLHLLITQMIVFILAFTILDVQKIEARWLLPLMLPFVVLIPKYFRTIRSNNWNRLGFFAFLLVLLFQVLRTPIEKAAGIPSSVHYGFDAVSDKLRTQYADKEWFLPDVTYAGNIRLLNAEREVFALDDFSLPFEKQNVPNSVFMVKDKNEFKFKGILKDSIIGFGKDKESLYFFLGS
ncbi:MAG: ArnT family glycosyltransferase [Maribacter sp.]